MKTPNKNYFYKSDKLPQQDWIPITEEQYNAMTTDGRPKPRFVHLKFKVEDVLQPVQPTKNAEIISEEQPVETKKRGGSKNKSNE